MRRRTDPRRDRVFLLRLWPVLSGGQLVWRASLEDPRTGKHLGFGNLDDLVAYLRMQTGEGCREPDETKGGEDHQ